MKHLLIIPNRESEDRLEVLINYFKIFLKNEETEFLILNEKVLPKTFSTIEYVKSLFNLKELKSFSIPSGSRKESFRFAHQYALKNDYDHFVFFNEGWEDNICEFINILKNKEYESFDAVIGKRTPKKLNLGAIYDLISNYLVSSFSRQVILDNKCDSILLFKTNKLPNKINSSYPENVFFSDILLNIAKGKNIKFTDVDFGINYRSFLKLNTVRFFMLVFMLFHRFFYRKT